MKKSLSLFFFIILASLASAQSHISTQAHQSPINMIVAGSSEADFDKSYYSIGKDGYIVKWTSDDQGEHYQISDMESKWL